MQKEQEEAQMRKLVEIQKKKLADQEAERRRIEEIERKKIAEEKALQETAEAQRVQDENERIIFQKKKDDLKRKLRIEYQKKKGDLYDMISKYFPTKRSAMNFHRVGQMITNLKEIKQDIDRYHISKGEGRPYLDNRNNEHL